MSTNEHEVEPPTSESEGPVESAPGGLLRALAIDDVDMRDALKDALDPAAVDAEGHDSSVIAIQQRIRKESEGKYYADGWSRSSLPRSTYIVTGAVMLIVVAALAWLTSPTGQTLLP